MKTEKNIRLFIEQELIEGIVIELSEKASHYLCNVMRCQSNDIIKCFNSVNGEFVCRLKNADKKKTVIEPLKQIRAPEKDNDIWLIFAPLKKDKTDFVIEKAVELGVSKIIPVLTQYTNTDKIKIDRFYAQAIEAAEQCGRLSIPEICPLTPLKKILALWDNKRVLFFMDERRQGSSVFEIFEKSKGIPAAILIGPEGGFSDDEASEINAQKWVKNLSLGPRILRAETAATAALSVWQAVAGDWNNGKEQK